MTSPAFPTKQSMMHSVFSIADLALTRRTAGGVVALMAKTTKTTKTA